MTLTLTKTLDRYFTAQNAHDAEEMVACFSPDAEVRDEGRDYTGREEIRRWKQDTIAKYGITIKPLRRNEQDGITVVAARVTGNFPGSPAELTYDFCFAADGLIRTLRIYS